MNKRTPREFWEATLKGGFEEGMAWVEKIYGDIERPKPSETKEATGDALWSCYFTRRDDAAKTEQFKKSIADIQGMTPRQDAATKYASRQVMAYLADAIYAGEGLPERGGDRRIFATDGMWTSRFRREWGLFFDPHKAKAKSLTDQEGHERKEKNRGDHRHHAIDAVVTAFCSRSVQNAWENREKQAERDGINVANEEAIDNYRRLHPLLPPEPYKSREEFREAVRRAVFGDAETERPICHRAVKRRLIGELHEAFPRGPVLDRDGALTDKFTKRINILELKPSHLRMPRPETEEEAVARLAKRYIKPNLVSERQARKKARALVESKCYTPRIVDPPPEKSGIVRDRGLRRRLRDAIASSNLNPDNFTPAQIKAAAAAGAIQQGGVPIRAAVLLWTIKDPVVVSRWGTDHKTGRRYKIYDAITGEGDASAARVYIGGNQHHIEIRADENGNWSGEMISAFEAAQRKLTRLRALREAGIPKPNVLRKLTKAERAKFKPILSAIEQGHPLVDRSDNDEKGGKFLMSLCEGETLFMKHKQTDEVGYFVVAKLDKPQSIVLVPHWDARAAGERKDAEGKKVPNSKRDQFAVTPTDLMKLAPPNQPHAVKVRVSPISQVTVLRND